MDKLTDDDVELFADVDDLRSRWSDIRTGFVDDPRRAIEQADELVCDVMDRVTRRFAEQRELLESSWHNDDDGSTERLRVAMQHYRGFFERLLAT